MAEMIYKSRSLGGHRYKTCPNCHHEIETEHPIRLDMPYCGDCGKIVLDANQQYCCWCGERFEESEDE